jgi:hypothetical protein
MIMCLSFTFQKLDLCRRLYRLIFQLILLFENFVKLMDIFRSLGGSPQVRPLSLIIQANIPVDTSV